MTNVIEHQLWDAITFPADDGYELHGRWFEPSGEARGVVLIVPAMATPAAYYATFASWLRDRGFAVMTFDYRGYGESLDGPMRQVTNDLVRWALDARDALDHAHVRAERPARHVARSQSRRPGPGVRGPRQGRPRDQRRRRHRLLAAQHPERPPQGSPAVEGHRALRDGCRRLLPRQAAAHPRRPPRQRHAPVGSLVHASGLPARRAARDARALRRGRDSPWRRSRSPTTS